MNLDKKQILYLGVGLFLFLVIMSSNRKIELKEVGDSPVQGDFDHNSLPLTLQPPFRVDNDQDIPQTFAPKRNLSGISLKPRFDR